MENTEKVLFEDDSPRWYVAVGESWIGPLTPSDVYEKVLNQELSWAHFVSKGGQSDWKRICDTPEFQVAVPQQPGRQLSKNLQAKIKEEHSQPAILAGPSARERAVGKKSALRPVDSDDYDRGWFLYYNDAQFGPFSKEELMRFIRIGKVHGRVHTWRNGMDGWERLDRVSVFDEVLAEARKTFDKMPPTFNSDRTRTLTQEIGRGPAPEKARSAKAEKEAREERRVTPRAPLVAKIVMARESAVSVALCRDISVGGMQVLTEEPPGAVGAKVKLNVSMAGKATGEAKIEPFVAEGVIVRILEDGHGFSFRFGKLSEAARRTIERYIDSLS